MKNPYVRLTLNHTKYSLYTKSLGGLKVAGRDEFKTLITLFHIYYLSGDKLQGGWEISQMLQTLQ